MAITPIDPEDGAFYQRDRQWHPPALTPGYKSTMLRAPRHALLSLGATKSELTGPTFGHSMLNPLDNDLIRNFSQDGSEAIGQRIQIIVPPELEGTLSTLTGSPVPPVAA